MVTTVQQYIHQHTPFMVDSAREMEPLAEVSAR